MPDSPLGVDEELLHASLESVRRRVGQAAADLFDQGKALAVSDAIRLAVETGSAAIAPEGGEDTSLSG